MDFIQYLILGLIQGITEFLPISSSAHLILLPQLTGWQDQGLAIDVAAHFGSLLAVLSYFHKEISAAFQPWLNSSAAHSQADKMFVPYIAVASFPVLAVGLLAHDFISMHLRSTLVIGLASIGFGILLWWADISASLRRAMHQLTMKDAIIIGLAQMLALIPGTSRSGITMTAALMLGLDRKASARFSFLLSVPVILAASAYETLKFITTDVAVDITGFFIVLVTSAISAFITIHYFMVFIERTGMLPYVVYRILLGVFLLLFI